MKGSLSPREGILNPDVVLIVSAFKPLLAIFVRVAGLVPPRPTRSKPLSAYPLTTRRPPVSSCGVEEALKVLERARDLVGGISGDRDVNGTDEADGSTAGEGIDEKSSEKSAVAEGIRSLILATWEDVKEWCDEEAEARVRRKDSQVWISVAERGPVYAVDGHVVWAGRLNNQR